MLCDTLRVSGSASFINICLNPSQNYFKHPLKTQGFLFYSQKLMLVYRRP